MILTFLFLFLFLIIHINLQQSDEHAKQDTEKLQVGTRFSHLGKDQYHCNSAQLQIQHYLRIIIYCNSINTASMKIPTRILTC